MFSALFLATAHLTTHCTAFSPRARMKCRHAHAQDIATNYRRAISRHDTPRYFHTMYFHRDVGRFAIRLYDTRACKTRAIACLRPMPASRFPTRIHARASASPQNIGHFRRHQRHNISCLYHYRQTVASRHARCLTRGRIIFTHAMRAAASFVSCRRIYHYF